MHTTLSLRKPFPYPRVHPPTHSPSPPRRPASYHRWRARARSVSLFFLIYNIIFLLCFEGVLVRWDGVVGWGDERGEEASGEQRILVA